MSEEADHPAPMKDKWLTAVPLFIAIYFLFRAATQIEQIRNLEKSVLAMQVPMAWPQQLATSVSQSISDYWYFAIPLASFAIGFHFNWVAKSQKRTMVAGQLWFIVLLLTLFLFTYGLNSTMLNLDSMLRRK